MKGHHPCPCESNKKFRHCHAPIYWKMMEHKFFEAVPNIELKDDVRSFKQEQRLAIYRKDNGMCQLKIKCDGEKCNWDNWEADHITPHSKGGKTIVSNGQVACPSCNSSKGNRI